MKHAHHMFVRLVLAGVVTACCCAIGHAQPPLSSREMVGLSATQADEKVRDDLLSILRPAPKFSRGMFVAVRGASMDTIPRPLTTKGLCAKDQLILWYGPTSVKPDPMNEPERPTGVSVRHLYHATGKAEAEDDRASAVAHANGGDCKQPQVENGASWFEAQSSEAAAKAVNVLLAAVTAIRSGTVKVPSCDYREIGKTCEESILAHGNIGSITDVSDKCSAGSGEQCLVVFVEDSLGLTIKFKIDQDALSPKEILDVSADTYIVVT